MTVIKFLISILCALAVMQAVVAGAQHTGFGIGIVPTMLPPGTTQPWPATPIAPFGSGLYFVPGGAKVVPETPGTQIIPSFPGFNGQPAMKHPIAPFVTSPVQPFASHPGFPATPVPRTIHRRGLRGPAPIVTPNTPLVIITNQPRAVFVSPRQQLQPQIRHIPSIGATRASVIAQWGSPAVTLITRQGETLIYTSGPTVVIQNGQVVSTK
jgi:hypothetical protein